MGNIKKLALSTVVSGYILLTQAAMAVNAVDDTVKLGDVQKQGISAGTSLNTVVKNVITIVFSVAAIAVLAFLILGAFNWITSGGDKEKVKNARGAIVHALIGLAVLALAFLLVRVVGQIVGFDVLSDFKFPTLSE